MKVRSKPAVRWSERPAWPCDRHFCYVRERQVEIGRFLRSSEAKSKRKQKMSEDNEEDV